MDSENRERQAAELMLLISMYPSEFLWRNETPPDLTQFNFEEPSFALELHPSYTLEFSLPETYPSDAKPQTYLVCGETISTSTRKAARAALQTIVTDQDPNIECLDLIINAFVNILPTFTANPSQTSDPDPSASNNPARTNKNQDKDEKTKQVTIWSHHLLATSKRRAIQSWSRELSLSGYARPGHPGAIFAEGYESDVDEFVRRLKELRWQALQVRAEDVVERRVLGGGAGDGPGEGIIEVESLGEIVEALKGRDEGVARLFLDGMKISGGGGAL